MLDTSELPLLEREAALAALVGYADEARRGHGRLVLVAGEAGVGKSALVEKLQRQLPKARWAWGACDGLFTPRPLGPLFDLADQLGGPLLGLCRDGTRGVDRTELFRTLLQQVSEPAALDVVVVEDVHWADEATLDLLRYVGRRLRDASVLLIATYRDDAHSWEDPLSVALGDLVTLRSTRRIGLSPLSERAVAVLAEGSGRNPAELFRLTGGNPFYVTEVLQTGAEVVPTSARDAVLSRVARLAPETHAVLDVAALTGSRFELRLLESAAECSPAIVDELLASGLLVEDGVLLRFRHEIARLAVEQSIAAHRSGAIHCRILPALYAVGCDDDALLAYHAEAAGDGAAVLRHAPAAARRAATLGAHREAAVQLRRALRFASAEADPSSVAGLLDELADELALGDNWPDAAAACDRALALWRAAGDRLREGDSLRRHARAMWNLCRGDDAVAAGEAAIAILEPLGPTVELAWAYATLANRRMLCAEDEEATRLALRAQEIAERVGATDVYSDALITQAASATRTVHNAGEDDWSVQMARGLRIALSGGHHDQVGRAYANFCGAYCDKRQYAEAEPCFAEGIAYCDERELTTFTTFLRGEQANMLDGVGRWSEAVTLSEEILAVAGPAPANRLCALRRLGTIRARRGEPGAWELLDEAAAAAEAIGQPVDMVAVRLARAEAYWLAGKTEEAMAEAERADDVAETCDDWLRGATAVWLARTGSVRLPRGPVAEPYRLELESDLVGAAESWTGLGCPYPAALALTGTQGIRELRDAQKIFLDLGATPAARIAGQRLRLLDPRAASAARRSPAPSHPYGLTTRELEVLALIRNAHTNAQIAAKLFISTKTVGHHVSAILAKMNAPNRSAAAHEAARLDLVGVPQVEDAESNGRSPGGGVPA
ncbi:AAA family ATPase [Streptosporangiaceae bacterium NEAU-GS5]|nr:AAA family ATPase [Streptosporangiaceae bacterium NEAU-GS5]